ncbi:EXS family protein isoform 1 [Dorcoceras hygrometricum]|uniref:EXS family protein isoform 1 n=1 Tax=Dorcoceras hygrometricum TaxID=472368 RepID=A0A2Z7C961_9LAMI|nr:EXS family protein isoform 1 [Dorcoceras hygrometricum]
MKFGKELASKMVQEWQEAYLDYKHLKKLLKNILKSRQQTALATSSASQGGLFNRTLTLYRSFSGLTGGRESCVVKSEDEVIFVNQVQPGGPEDGGFFYQTVFLKTPEDGGDMESNFFKELDEELNKVLRFYREKVQEVTTRAGELSKQMGTLVSLKAKVHKPLMKRSGNHQQAESSDLVHEDATMDVIEEVEESPVEASEHRTNVASLSSLDHVKINIEPNCPVTTIMSVIKSTTKSDLKFSSEELRHATDVLQRAFIEFHRQLGLLRSYRLLNMLALSKILKKYDKITSTNASKSYLQTVGASYLGSSDEVNKLIDRVETTFIRHFSKENRRRGMKLLKPKNKMERHRITFALGILTGCSLALVSNIIVSIQARGLIKHEGRDQYMNNIFPLYSLFIYIFLHMFMYGINTYLWKRIRVNYPFIFGLKSGTELGFREIFLLASTLLVLTLVAVLSNLDMEMDPRTQHFQALTELVPAGLVTDTNVQVLLLITFCPFNIIYGSSRFFFIRCTWRCICAPFYKVMFADFFLADQLTSQAVIVFYAFQIQALRSLQFYVCYYGWGDYKRRSNQCSQSKLYGIFYIVVAIIPFWSRFLQCLRRMFEEKDLMQGVNGLKYLSTVAALVIRTIYDSKRGTIWKIMAASSSGVTTIFSTYWDIVMDWGLLRKNSRNPWLRDKLLVESRAVYFVAIVVNILLRLVWMQLVLGFDEAPFIHRRAMVALVACLEILRRGVWNFFRLENEHFDNFKKYRAFKSSRFPFHHQDENFL